MSLPEGSPLVSDGVDGVRTTRMLERAIRQRWPITDEQRKAIMERQIDIATDGVAKRRERIAAAKTVIAADKLNMQEEKPEEPTKHLHLHQHNETAIDYSKISVEDLERIEKELIDLSSGARTVEAEAGVVQEKPV